MHFPTGAFTIFENEDGLRLTDAILEIDAIRHFILI
jgi:hypothetical protein